MHLEHNRVIALVMILTTIISGCMSQNKSDFLTYTNRIMSEQKQNFGKDSQLNSLMSHFPSIVKNDSVSYFFSEPSCPPTFKCQAQFGEVVFLFKKSDYQEEFGGILSEKTLFESDYVSDSNIVISLSELRKVNSSDERFNMFYANKFPIPYFENYDFNLGVLSTENGYIMNDSIPYDIVKYNVPSDLKAYVIEAEAGDFWKENCHEKRPDALKEWQHGYSKGVAVSEKEDIIVFWTMIW